MFLARGKPQAVKIKQFCSSIRTAAQNNPLWLQREPFSLLPGVGENPTTIPSLSCWFPSSSICPLSRIDSDRNPHHQRQRTEISYGQIGEITTEPVEPEMWQGKLAPGQSRCNTNSPPRKECARGQRQQDDESRRCQANKIDLTPVNVRGGRASLLGIKLNGNAS